MQESVYPSPARPTNGQAVGLIRVSSERSELEGYSLGVQEERVRAYAAARGLELLEVLSDTFSGMHVSRPGLDAVIDLVRARPGLLVIVINGNRFSRGGPGDGFFLKKLIEMAGGSIAFLDEGVDEATPKREADMKLFMSFWEGNSGRDTIVANLAMGKRAKVDAGLLPGYGPAPFGYTWKVGPKGRNVHHLVRVGLEIEPVKADVVRRIFRAYLAGRSLAGIAADLDADGVARAGQAAAWHPTVVREILRNPVYCGDACADRWTTVAPRQPRSARPTMTPDGRPVAIKRTTMRERPVEERKLLPDAAPAIVDRTDWLAVQDRLAINRTNLRRAPRDPADFLLQQRIFCAACTSLMSPQAHNGPRYFYRYYRCTCRAKTRKNCINAQHHPAGPIDDDIWRRVEALILDPAKVGDALATYAAAPDPNVGARAAAEATLAELAVQRQNLRQNLLHLSGDDAVWAREQLVELAARIEGAEARVAALAADAGAWEALQARRAALLAGLGALREKVCQANTDPALRRELLKDLDVRVEVGPPGAEPPWEAYWDGGKLLEGVRPSFAMSSVSEQPTNTNAVPSRLPLPPAA
jgi:site-specific DNA recombinase